LGYLILFCQNLHRAVAINGDRLDKRRIEVFQAQSAVDVAPASACAGFDGAGFDPLRTQPKAGLVWCSGCTASAK